LNDEAAQKLVKNTVKLSTLSATDFDAIFYVGGHGPIVDLAVDKDSIKLIEDVSPVILIYRYTKSGTPADSSFPYLAVLRIRKDHRRRLPRPGRLQEHHDLRQAPCRR
jgi:hypothetical protein